MAGSYNCNPAADKVSRTSVFTALSPFKGTSLRFKNFPRILGLFFGISFWAIPCRFQGLEIYPECELYAAGVTYGGGLSEGGVRIRGIAS